MKDPKVESLNKRTRFDVVNTFILTGISAFICVCKLSMHDPGGACSEAFLTAIFLLIGLIFVDIRKNGKPFAKSVIRKMHALAFTVICSGTVSNIVDSIAHSSGDNFQLSLNLDDRFGIVTVVLGIAIGMLSEVFVYGHALQEENDLIA